MLRYALRRLLWAVPTIFGISLVVFFVTTLIPDPASEALRTPGALVVADPEAYDAAIEARRTRFLDLPAFFNASPQDVKVRAKEAMRHLVAGDDLASVGAHELARLGGAALPYVIPGLDELSPPARARVAVALAPIAVRMGENAEDLDEPSTAVLFWTRFWEDRSLDFTQPAVARSVRRLVARSTELRARDLSAVDTFALGEVVPAMAETDDREAIRTLAEVASHATGRNARVRFDADDDELRRVVQGWQTWWRVHATDFTALDGAGRVGATVLETRYGKWVLGAATGRLGTSVRDGEPIADKLKARAPVTIALALVALFASFAIAVPLGALGAWWRGRPVDAALAVLLFALYSLPTFWAAQLLAHSYLFAPSHGALPVPLDRPMEALSRIALPAFALALGSLATLSRYQRAATLEVIRLDYVRAAKAKGASALRQIVVHALRNAMLPTVTLAGLQFPALLGGAFVVEEVFAVPGIGYETLRAVEAHDTPWLVAAALVTALATTIALIASDVAYGLLDPRIRDASMRGPGAPA